MQPRSANDLLSMKMKRKKKLEEEKPEWYGMKRREITPEERAELLAIDLRG